MKLIHGCLIVMLALMPITSSAQDITIVDTSSPMDPLVDPTIVMTPVNLEPNCKSYTGCGLMVVNPKPVKVVYKHKKHRVHRQACPDQPVAGDLLDPMHATPQWCRQRQ